MGNTDDSHRVVSQRREKTNRQLASERGTVDKDRRAKNIDVEQRTDQDLEEARRQLDKSLDAAAQDAGAKAVEPAAESSDLDGGAEQVKEQIRALANSGPSSRQLEHMAEEAVEATKELAHEAVEAVRQNARVAVETVSERAADLIDAERHHTDELTAVERDARKFDFMEVLAAEREQTDAALHQERSHSDSILHGRDGTLAIIAHDLRNYLNALSIRAELLGSIPAEETKKHAEEISRACRIMARWANDLVDIATVDSGSLSVELSAQAPAEIVSASLETFAVAAKTKGVEVTLTMPETLPKILADRDRLVQVLNNLLDNALKFTASGSVAVALERANGFVRFRVTDTGPGISEGDREKIFDRYWRAPLGKHGGTGLGLFICKRIVEAHAGHISVENAPGRGSTFLFTIPVAP